MVDEKIVMNGVTYLSERYVKEEYTKNTDIKTDTKPYLNIKDRGQLILDNKNVMGIGSADLSGEWFKSRYSIEYLEKALKMLKVMEIEIVDLIVAKDYPVLIGKVDKDNGKFAGFVIAPRVGSD